MHTNPTCTASVNERSSPSHPPGRLVAQATPNRSPQFPPTPSSCLRAVVPFRDSSGACSSFTLFDSQMNNLMVYAKFSPGNPRERWQQHEHLQRIRHFSKPIMRIFEEFHTFHEKNMRIFQQIHTFPPSKSRKNIPDLSQKFNALRHRPRPTFPLPPPNQSKIPPKPATLTPNP